MPLYSVRYNLFFSLIRGELWTRKIESLHREKKRSYGVPVCKKEVDKKKGARAEEEKKEK